MNITPTASADSKSTGLSWLRAVLIGAFLLVLSFVIAGLAGGACHCVTPTAIFFPYTAIVRGAFSLESLSILLFAIQFPLYALIVGIPRSRNGKFLMALIVLALHVGAAVVGVRVYRHG